MESISNNVFFFLSCSQTAHPTQHTTLRCPQYCPTSVYGGIKRSLNCPLTLFASRQVKVLWNLLIFQFVDLAKARLVTGPMMIYWKIIWLWYRYKTTFKYNIYTINTKLSIDSTDNWLPHAVTVYRHFKVATSKKKRLQKPLQLRCCPVVVELRRVSGYCIHFTPILINRCAR